MQNPYGPLFSNQVDRTLVWMGVTIVMVTALVAGAKRPGSRGENYYACASSAFFALCAVVLLIFLAGVVGASLNITSIFWAIWQLLFLVSVVAVFQVFPVVGAILVLWGVLGKAWCSYSLRPLATSALAAAFAGIDCGLYFLVQRLME